ncbi:hypothetical protein BP5796_07786 [Coleophoma crateriformis]|uniref:Uncharacterized protein n=1 Tax=Coleophoma crateriformis TaxID=565419 RepID=A0A3D8RCI4_9HELO|nr:hypothetical protein BP5796_07786 [Coleophoma crateriformis]
MAVFRLLSICLPVLAFMVVSASGTQDLVERQATLASLIADLTNTLAALQILLSADSLNNIESIVTNGAKLLTPTFTNQTQSLIGTASAFLQGINTSSVNYLLGSVSLILTPQLLANVTNVLGGANDLLTPEFISQTKTLIANAGPLLAALSPLVSALSSAAVR